MQISEAPMEISMEFPQKSKNRAMLNAVISFPGMYLKEFK
jgi:hypothetical protein